MAIPKFQEFFAPVLKYLNDQNQSCSRQEILNSSIEYFKPTDDELNEKIPSNGSSKFLGRASWAIVYLKQAELIEAVDKAIYQITDLGKDFLLKFPVFSLKELKLHTPFIANRTSKDNQQNNVSEAEMTEEQESVFDFEKALNDHEQVIKFSILDQLKSLSDSNHEKGALFEELCLELLLKVMNCNSGEKIGGSGDKGVDLKLHVDQFKLNSIGVQCKCTQHSISAKDINHFRGGLEEHGLNKGIFITISKFTQDAKERTDNINGTNTNIALIDGSKFVDLMMKYEVGVKKHIHYSYEILLDQE